MLHCLTSMGGSMSRFDQHLSGIGMTSARTRKRLVKRLQENGIRQQAVLDALAELPRHIFIDEALAHRAYEDTALPIGYQQTISQPWVVARMTELLLEVKPHRVLEVGTGSGFQAALLAMLGCEVYTVERISGLLNRARERFRLLGLHIHSRLADGHWGWAEHAPFDAIMVTAAPAEVPEELLWQLAEGGRLVIPVGADRGQSLQVIDRVDGIFQRCEVARVSFVPLRQGVES